MMDIELSGAPHTWMTHCKIYFLCMKVVKWKFIPPVPFGEGEHFGCHFEKPVELRVGDPDDVRRNLEAVPRPCFPAPRDAQGCGSRLGPPCACASPGAAAETKISSISLLIYLLFQTASLSPLSLCHSAMRLPHFRKHLTLKKLLISVFVFAWVIFIKVKTWLIPILPTVFDSDIQAQRIPNWALKSLSGRWALSWIWKDY